MVYISLSVLVCGLHFTNVRNLSDNKSSRSIVFEIDLWAHRNDGTVFTRRSQIFVDRILDWHSIFIIPRMPGGNKFGKKSIFRDRISEICLVCVIPPLSRLSLEYTLPLRCKLNGKQIEGAHIKVDCAAHRTSTKTEDFPSNSRYLKVPKKSWGSLDVLKMRLMEKTENT